jgi:hypothetical protein
MDNGATVHYSSPAIRKPNFRMTGDAGAINNNNVSAFPVWAAFRNRFASRHVKRGMPKQEFVWSLFFIACVAVAQETERTLPNIEALLVMEKQQFLLGEPITMIFIARYTGAGSVSLSESDAYGQCSPYHIAVDPEASRHEPKSGPPCAPLFRIRSSSCLSGALNLIPGGEVKQQILLNRLHDFTHPGTYVVQATRHLSYSANWGKMNQPTGQASATFTFTIVAPHTPEDIKDSFSLYLADLFTSSYLSRQEAASVIASLSAPFLEPYLLQMLSTPDLKRQAIKGLYRLNTEKGRKAIFDLIKKDDSFALDQQLALQALQDMRDASYGPQFLALMNSSSNIDEKAKLLVAAARLDPTNTLPIIQPLLKSSNEKDREKGVTALAATEQPTALPILVRALSDSSLPVRSAAAQGLVSLTRETPSKDGLFWSGTDPATDAPFWSAWLRANPQLPIHPIHECHEAGGW